MSESGDSGSRRNGAPHLTAWLAAEIRPMELADEELQAAMLAQCRRGADWAAGRVDRIAGPRGSPGCGSAPRSWCD
jgi:hypothetical protein